MILDIGINGAFLTRRWEEPAVEAEHHVALADGAGGRAWAAPGDLAHILDNLIENAISYTPRGKRITVATDRVDGRPALVVADDGPGIPPEEQERVFDRFYRGAGGRRTAPGTGLRASAPAGRAERGLDLAQVVAAVQAAVEAEVGG